MNNKQIKNIDGAYKLLGAKTVLIPIKTGEKRPSIKSWKNLNLELTQEENFQEKLKRSLNVAVLQGQISSGLCSIDLDKDEFCEDFLRNNPSMHQTLITKGERGANFWFYALGDVPKVKKFDWGEIRGEGGYTVLYGIHPSGKKYTVINMNSPVVINLEDIVLPQNNETINFSISESISYNYVINSLNTPTEKIEALKQSKERYNDWEEGAAPNLIKYYKVFIERDGDMDFNIRNKELIRQTTLLHEKLGTRMTCKLIKSFYEINKPFFNDEVHQHMHEFKTHLNTLEINYLNKLSEIESNFYQAFDIDNQDAFRICRELAMYEDNEYEYPFFHLSYKELGDRLDIHRQDSFKIMKDFKTLGILELKKKGEKYKSGRKSKASSWKWVL